MHSLQLEQAKLVIAPYRARTIHHKFSPADGLQLQLRTIVGVWLAGLVSLVLSCVAPAIARPSMALRDAVSARCIGLVELFSSLLVPT